MAKAIIALRDISPFSNNTSKNPFGDFQAWRDRFLMDHVKETDLPKDDVFQVKGILNDASGGHSDTKHILLCWHECWHGDPVNVRQVADVRDQDAEKGEVPHPESHPNSQPRPLMFMDSSVTFLRSSLPALLKLWRQCGSEALVILLRLRSVALSLLPAPSSIALLGREPARPQGPQTAPGSLTFHLFSSHRPSSKNTVECRCCAWTLYFAQ